MEGFPSFGLVRFVYAITPYSIKLSGENHKYFKVHSDNCSGLKRKLRHVFFLDATKKGRKFKVLSVGYMKIKCGGIPNAEFSGIHNYF